MSERVLITGGAGFIGSHVARHLLERGNDVRALDSLSEQVHGGGGRPAYLEPDVELIEGDVRDAATVDRALDGVDTVVHFAARVGVGQSMYEIADYQAVNACGTAILLEALMDRPVRKLLVASSMSIYGEGLYRTADGDLVEDAVRAPRVDPADPWDPLDAQGRPLVPVPTPEWKRPALASVYALGKYVQERLTLTLSPAYGMEGVALRLWNVYGPGQALSNPYTGVLAIFSSRLHNGKPPVIFEDGHQRRDFVHVEDIADAFVLALEHPKAAGEVYNIASGEDRSVREVAALLASAMGRDRLGPEIAGQARAGDIRHCIADIAKARQELGFAPKRDFAQGLAALAEWVARQEAEDRVHEARKELELRGLVA
jgi:dTDP-L-rhamnose 4-epimerase